MEYGGGGNRWRSPRGGGGGWHNNSPRFRGGGGGGYNQNFSPRFGGGGGGGGGGRWRHRHSSPYDPNFSRHRSPFQSPQHLPISSPRFFSTPQRFFSPRHQNPADLPIDAWVSPAMWEDPWKHLIEGSVRQESHQDSEDLTTDNLQEDNMNIRSDAKTPAAASVELTDDKDIPADSDNDAFESEAGKDLLAMIS